MKKILFLLGLVPFTLQAQVINTTVGTGVAGYSGDGGSAVTAKIRQPSGAVWDHAGNMYISDYGNHVIRKITPSGTISTYAGTGVAGYNGDGIPATAAQLSHQVKIYMDASDNLYIADAENNRVRKVTAAGVITTIAGDGSAGFSGDGGPATAAQLDYPAGVMFDLNHNMYITDYHNNRIRKIAPSGIISTFAGNGVGGYGGDGGPATAASLYGLFGMVFDAAQNMYVADAANNRVRKITTAGIISTFAGTGIVGSAGDGGPASAAQLFNPAGVTIDAAGNIYISDQMNAKIRIVNTAGIISNLAGNGVTAYCGDGGAPILASINDCNEVAINPLGNLVICDVGNNRIRVVSGTGACAPSAITTSGSRIIAVGTDAVFSVTTMAPFPSYQWMKRTTTTGFVPLTNTLPYSGVLTDTLTIHTASVGQDSTFYKCVIVYGDGCGDSSATDSLFVRKNLGVNNMAAIGKISVYPNPTHSYVNISMEEFTNNAMVQVYSNIGSLLLEKPITSASSQIDISNLPVGVYLFRIYSGGQSQYATILKQ